jgi:hypothetical protein
MLLKLLILIVVIVDSVLAVVIVDSVLAGENKYNALNEKEAARTVDADSGHSR